MATAKTPIDESGQIRRPFYFMVPFWGTRYREYFVNFCLPSLLAPNNLPILNVEDGHRLLIATTKADWAAIEHLPIMEKTRRHVQTVLVEIEPPPLDTGPGSDAVLRHHSFCQKKLLEIAFRDRAYGSQLFPDLLISDGMVASLLQHAAAGKHLVLYAALRQNEETLIAELTRRKFIDPVTHISSGAIVTLPPRLTIDLAIRHMHPDLVIYEAGHPSQPLIPQHQYWRVSGNRGHILRSYYGVPALMDYGAIINHDTNCLDEDIFEEIYVLRNFYLRGNIHVVQDSDEFAVLSLTPALVQRSAPLEAGSRPLSWWSQLIRIRASMTYHVGIARNPLKRDIFRHPVRWHVGDLDRVWHQEEKRIEAFIHAGIGDYFRGADRHGKDFFPRISFNPLRLLIDLSTSSSMNFRFNALGKWRVRWNYGGRYLWIILRALAGHTASRERIRNSLHRRMSNKRGRKP